MLSHPEQLAARSRYGQSFQSNIFAPPPEQGRSFQPAGKRRDQTTAELFGSYEAKEDLRSMPKTFKPREDERSAYEKKQQFLSSHLQGESQHQAEPPRPRGAAPASEAGYVQAARPAFNPYEEEEAVDTHVRRQEELKSKLFGRATPACGHPGAPSAGGSRGPDYARLTPNDLQWHDSAPERRAQPDGRELTHADRAYREKCSQVFDHQTPQVQKEWEAQQRQLWEEERRGEANRRANAHFSDLFGRVAEGSAEGDVRRPRTQEDKLFVEQDWTNAKTELEHARAPRIEEPRARKSQELYGERAFGERPPSSAGYHAAERPASLSHDNTDKLREARGRGTQQIHQAHLRTSMQSPGFYEEAEGARHWEVAEMHLSGLGRHASDESVRDLCQGFDLQLVKVAAEVDPVRNLCKGRAKVVVRYNPQREQLEGLVRRFQDCNLKVEM